MKQLFFLTMAVVQAMAGHSQTNEFTVYPNGLVYSDTTMKQLKYIVDSLNLKFRHCELNKKYYPAQEGIVHYIDLKNGHATAAFHDIQQGISFKKFIQKYGMAGCDTNLLLTKIRYKNYQLQDIDYYTTQRPDNDYEPFIELCSAAPGAVEEDLYSIKGINGNWVFDYTKPGKRYLDRQLRAFYIVSQPASVSIPDKYAKLILYADCMIDTTVGIYYPGAWDGSRWSLNGKDSTHPHARIDAFNNYISRETGNVYEKYQLLEPKTYDGECRDSLLKKYVLDSLSNKPRFRQLLSDGVQEALSTKARTSDFFEYCTAEYYSKSAALSMMRNRRVVGSCSADERPRIHAIHIAMLAAETANWEVFLRAHLDIMNDRFDRVSDGSYAWAARNTYIREIEDLDIDVQDLMLGISLYAGNAPANHYFGSIGRLGRAFAETKYNTSLEQKLLAMIADPLLDAYNRLRMRYLYLDYVYYLPRKEDRLACLQKLEEADKTLPLCIASRIKTDRKTYEQGNVRR